MIKGLHDEFPVEKEGKKGSPLGFGVLEQK